MRTFVLNSILYSSLLIGSLSASAELIDQDRFLESRQHQIEKRSYEWPDGRSYEGEWMQAAPHGQGMLTYPDGGQYWGRFSHGKRQGEGMMKYVNGDEYEGEWFNDLPQGPGVFRYANGARYEGEFEQGKKSGKGRHTYADGTYYDGQWRQNIPHGFGRLTFLSGGSYEGQFNEGQPDGRGLYYFANGDLYDGEWRQGKQDGIGRFDYATGGFYEGGVVGGQREGKGVWVTALGQRYEGTFKANQAEGRGRCGTPGQLEPCTYRNGKRVITARPPVVASHESAAPSAKVLTTSTATLALATASPAAPVAQAPSPKPTPKPAGMIPLTAKVAIPAQPQPAQPLPVQTAATQSTRFTRTLAQEKARITPKSMADLNPTRSDIFFHDNWAAKNLMALPGQAGWKKRSSLFQDQLEIISRHGDTRIRMLISHYKGPGRYPLSLVTVESPSQSFAASSDEAGEIEITEDAQGWISGKFQFNIATDNGRKFDVRDGVFRISAASSQPRFLN